MRGRIATLLAVIAAGLVVVGCGDDGKTSSTATGGTKTTTTTAAPPTGAPITVMTIVPVTIPQTGTKQETWAQAPQARVDAINREGGINGHPLEEIICDIQNDPNRELACAREAIAKKVVAVVGCDCPYGDNTLPLLEKAGIPVIGSYPQGKESVTSPISFPFTPGVAGVFAGMPRVLAEQGAKKIGYIHQDLGQATANTFKYVELGVKAAGATYTGRTGVAPDVTDFAPSIAAAARSKPDGLVTFFYGDASATFVRQAREQLPDVPLAVVASANLLTPELIKSLGASANGVFIVGQMPPSDADLPGAKLFREDVAAADKSFTVEPGDSQAIAMWMSMWVFGRVAATLPEGGVTSAALLKAMGELKDFDMGGLTPPLTTTEAMTDVPDAPRLFNPHAVFAEIKDGKSVLLPGGFVNPFKPTTAG